MLSAVMPPRSNDFREPRQLDLFIIGKQHQINVSRTARGMGADTADGETRDCS